ncbi:MAG: 16S rRNA (guanine(966)-N(2))-methyltransferase RsmD [Thiopseudomonas sp.]|nr:16S rRNA (guanine(966)-N(2))-methyltransferase RsmD [Thiopseudomonas sp.]MCK9464409.1 16S rRNA (guanine(966)-N(2))-methyltransferase RsmD [Thiopseudomonas sp.]
MARTNNKQSSNQLRIIGGQWRSRKLSFPDVQGLRPTPDRVRETLYNWLAPRIAGAHILDVFAGSGALFFEGLSRGAASGLAIELDRHACHSLQQNLHTLDCTNARVVQENALSFLARPTDQSFDIALLDPPFHQDLLLESCHLLEQQGWLKPDAWIYTESEQAPSMLAVPQSWRLHREKHAGLVYYALWHRTPPTQ